VPIPLEEIQDPQGINMGEKNLSRDPARTPMQWDNSANAGFTTGKPWLRISKNYQRVNVESQKQDPHSMLSFYRNLVALRQREPALKTGNYVPVHADPQVISFIREAAGAPRYMMVLNLSHRPCYFSPKHINISGVIELSTYPESDGEEIGNRINLSGDEGIIIRLHS
jgi:alpha-glucosidase